jgi:threonine dehydrogenase-like Zn-dependent dehydrogenase
VLALSHEPARGPELGERDVPRAGAGEALVRVQLAGICNTDLEIVRGYMGFAGVLGHELLGVVERCDDVRWVGKRVVGEINLACGACSWCARGLGRHCATRRVLGIVGKDGCFAEHATLPIANLHEVPDEIDDRHAVFVEPLAAAFEIVEQVAVAPGMRVLVAGDGKLGLLCAMVLRDRGADVTVLGRHARKLAIAANVGCRTATVDDFDEVEFDLAVEATGSSAGLASAIERVRPRGTVVLKSTTHGAAEVHTARIVVPEITLVGSRCGPFAPAIAALRAGAIDPTPLIDDTFALADGLRALARAAEPGVLKVLLDPR